jgi:propanol-preferring alcohol dehydrogenase
MVCCGQIFASLFLVSMTSEASIPRTQRAAVTFAHDKPVVIKTDWPVPAPSDLEAGQCLVRMIASGVCHSDLHIRDGEWGTPKPLPLVGGHEGVGIVVAIAAGTPENNAVRVGTRVGVKWTAGACEQCEMCRSGNEPGRSL